MLRFSKPIDMLRGFLVCVTACTLIACGGGGGNSTTAPVIPAPAATLVAGKVLGATGTPIAGATVSAAGVFLTTGIDGSYTFNLDPAITTTVVLVKKTGYATTAKELPIASGTTTQMNLQLFADQVSTTFSGAASVSIPVNGATVTIPANSVKLADGGDYTGTVSIGASYYSPDTVQGVQAFAGPYTGVDAAGVKSPIISMGFIEVKLTDASGGPLQLKIGSPASLTFPASSNSANTTSVPMWFYDETAKIWKNEGSATRQADGSYLGSVTHFTIWNVDFKGATATIKGCLRDAAGQPISNVGSAGLRSTGWSQTLFLRDPAGTAPGDFTILNVPANLPLELYSASSPSAFTALAIPAIAPGTTRTLASCITATAAPAGPNVITWPTLVFTTTVALTTPTGTASYAGTYNGTYGGAETGTFTVVVSAAGVVTGTNHSITFNQNFTVNGQVGSTGSVALSAIGTAGSGQFSGSINAAGVISGTWNYVGSSLGGTFTGSRV
jgi:Carboxypeptidase regulatory-like domain